MEKQERKLEGRRTLDKALDDMGGRDRLGKVIPYRQRVPHAGRRRKCSRGLCVTKQQAEVEPWRPTSTRRQRHRSLSCHGSSASR